MRIEAREELKEDIKEALRAKGYHFNQLLKTRYDRNAKGVAIELERVFKDIYIRRNMIPGSEDITSIQNISEHIAIFFGTDSDQEVVSTALIDAYQDRKYISQSFMTLSKNEGTFKSVQENDMNTIEADKKIFLDLVDQMPSCID